MNFTRVNRSLEMTLNLTNSKIFAINIQHPAFYSQHFILGPRASCNLDIFDKVFRTVRFHNINNVVFFRFHVIGGFPNYVIQTK